MLTEHYLPLLLEELQSVEAAVGWGPEVHAGWNQGFRGIRLIEDTPAGSKYHWESLRPLTLGLVQHFAGPEKEVVWAWYSGLVPGGTLDWHIDEPPYYERWHLPLVVPNGTRFYTNKAPTEQGSITMMEFFVPVPGQWFRVRHDLKHRVENRGVIARVHLIIDLKKKGEKNAG